jgi:hypothetical protein
MGGRRSRIVTLAAIGRRAWAFESESMDLGSYVAMPVPWVTWDKGQVLKGHALIDAAVNCTPRIAIEPNF